MAKKVNIRKVGLVLEEVNKVAKDRKDIFDKDGHLDILKLNKLSGVKKCIVQLKELGVKSNTDLIDMGYIVGGMILRF